MPQDAPTEPSVPRPAATVILARRGSKHSDRGLEVLLVKRNPGARFMPGVWVFPGGAVEADELVAGVAGAETDAGADELAHRAAAARELHEEAGIDLGEEPELVPWSRWITPEVVPIRFDTRFYLALCPPHQKPVPDGAETVDAGWFEPAKALERRGDDDLKLVFPTIKHLEALLPYTGADELFEAARDWTIVPVLPQVFLDGDTHRIVLPGEDGYDHTKDTLPPGG